MVESFEGMIMKYVRDLERGKEVIVYHIYTINAIKSEMNNPKKLKVVKSEDHYILTLQK